MCNRVSIRSPVRFRSARKTHCRVTRNWVKSALCTFLISQIVTCNMIKSSSLSSRVLSTVFACPRLPEENTIDSGRHHSGFAYDVYLPKARPLLIRVRLLRRGHQTSFMSAIVSDCNPSCPAPRIKQFKTEILCFKATSHWQSALYRSLGAELTQNRDKSRGVRTVRFDASIEFTRSQSVEKLRHSIASTPTC